MKLITKAMIITSGILIMTIFALQVNGETKNGTEQIDAGDSLTFTVQAGDGDMTFSWTITDYNDDNINFYIEAPNGGALAEVTDTSSFSDTLVVEAGYYRFVWKNNNWFEGLTVQYDITYKSYKEQTEDSICCSSFLIIPIVGLAGIISIIGYIKKK